MKGLLFFRVYPSDGFRFIFIQDGLEFPVLDGNPSSNMNLANIRDKLFFLPFRQTGKFGNCTSNSKYIGTIKTAHLRSQLCVANFPDWPFRTAEISSVVGFWNASLMYFSVSSSTG
jgi:hypothetical protein